ncbi:MAG TPA: hypothetical protein PLK77_06220 [Pyrinomonadaceae bacterium]|nr:hypothetical protein [Pyrinomonadaceae bacterium]
MNLESVSESLLLQFPNAQQATLQKQEKMLERFGTFVFGGFAIMIGLGAIGLIVGVILAMVVSGKDPLKGILLALFLTFASLALSYVVLNESLKDKRKKLQATSATTFSPSPETGRFLETGDLQPIPSVAEDTTDLLPVESRTRKL